MCRTPLELTMASTSCPCVGPPVLLPHECIYKEACILSMNPLLAVVLLPGKSCHCSPRFRLPPLIGASAPHSFPTSMCKS
jgi:hypothetical protein